MTGRIERAEEAVAWFWAGTDIGSTHHCGRVPASGQATVVTPGAERMSRSCLHCSRTGWPWTRACSGQLTSLTVSAALWTNILLNHGQPVVDIPGFTINRALVGYRG
jgi:hypothetical protein